MTKSKNKATSPTKENQLLNQPQLQRLQKSQKIKLIFTLKKQKSRRRPKSHPLLQQKERSPSNTQTRISAKSSLPVRISIRSTANQMSLSGSSPRSACFSLSAVGSFQTLSQPLKSTQ